MRHIGLNIFYFFQHLQYWIFPPEVSYIQYLAQAFNTFDMRHKGLKSNLFCLSPLLLTPLTWGNWYHTRTTLQESMQHGPSTPLTYPGSCKTCLFHIPVFGGKVSLIFPIIYLRVGLRSNLHIHLFDLVNPLISANSCPR